MLDNLRTGMMSVNVLIADDEVNQIQLLSFNLEQAGFNVLTANDGQEAIDQALEYLPDIIILDWMMPEHSGIEVCRTLRGWDTTKHIPIIMLSARGEEGDRTLGLDLGADDYVTKPFSPRELIARIHAVLRRARPSLIGDLLEVGPLKIFPASQIVERDGQVISLGPKEYKILSLLMERPGQVFSRIQLLDHVWGHGVYIDDRTVDVHLSRLRKALNYGGDGQPPKDDIIRTVRGSGYALITEI